MQHDSTAAMMKAMKLTFHLSDCLLNNGKSLMQMTERLRLLLGMLRRLHSVNNSRVNIAIYGSRKGRLYPSGMRLYESRA
jgi:hypothetical protein